jgi:uncharacterized protein
LTKKGFVVSVPKMPDTKHPKIKQWITTLQKSVKRPNNDIYLVGHSIGCQAIIRYLEKINERTKFGGVLFIAPWCRLKNLTDEEKKIATPWLKKDIKWGRVIDKSYSFTAVFSTNDPYVFVSDSKVLKSKIAAGIIIKKGMGHFNEETGITKLPLALNEIIKMSKAQT